jgi:hypothetical protein
MKNANATMTATIPTNVRTPTLLARSLFGMQFFLRFEANACFTSALKLKPKLDHRSAATSPVLWEKWHQ